MNFYLVAANSKLYPFQRVVEEFMKYGTVNWEIIGKGNRHLNKGDICLFYYTGIPEEQGRILFSAVVSEGVHNMPRGDIYEGGDSTIVPGFTVSDLKPLTSQAAADYVYDVLIQKYGIHSVQSSVQMLNEQHSALIRDLLSDTCSSDLESFQDLQDTLFAKSNAPQ